MNSELLNKIEKTSFSIGEVAELLDVNPSVLRFWQSEFAEINPKKNNAGIRRYSKSDIEILYKIKTLLYDEKYTIKGAKSVLDESSKKQDDQEKEQDGLRQDLLDLKNDVNRMINFIDASISNQTKSE